MEVAGQRYDERLLNTKASNLDSGDRQWGGTKQPQFYLAILILFLIEFIGVILVSKII